MASQGWKPGEYLGAKDAPHAEFHTSANASHIRVMIKDDNLGLGAKNGSGVGHGECTGLDAFKNLLGRLNGKDEDEIEKEQKSREDLKRAIYTEKRWGSIRFVQGGFLVGDKIQHLIEGEAERLRLAAEDVSSSADDSVDSTPDSSESDEEPEPLVEKPKKSKKRKLEELDEIPGIVAVKGKKSKKKRKSEATAEDVAEIMVAMGDLKTSKKKSKQKRDIEAMVDVDEDGAETKKYKKHKKDKKDRKEKKERSKAALEDESSKESKKKPKRDKRKTGPESQTETTDATQPITKENTPSTPVEVDSGRSTPMMQGRHAVRARNIAQKRLASMDVASLNQVSYRSSTTLDITNAS